MVSLASRVLAVLPQTQCTRCGYPDCAAYAQAIVDEQTPINRCPPGGAEGVARLAQLTGQPALPIDATHGTETERKMAFIDEDWCIGCTLCIKACPVDAIIGSNKTMHTVLETHCTGCELCIPVCPVDCIGLESATQGRTGWAAWSNEQAASAQARYARHVQRMSQGSQSAPESQAPATAATTDGPTASVSARRAILDAALARARRRQD